MMTLAILLLVLAAVAVVYAKSQPRASDTDNIPKSQVRGPMTPIYSATAIPVKAMPAEPTVIGVPFTLTIDPGRAKDMGPATQDVVHVLDGCTIQCKVAEFKEGNGRGMVISIDKIVRGETVVPFHCNRSVVHDPLRGVQPPKKFEFHPENHPWGLLLREESNQENLVLLWGPMTLLAIPKAAFLMEPMGDLAQDAWEVLKQHGIGRSSDYIELNGK